MVGYSAESFQRAVRMCRCEHISKLCRGSFLCRELTGAKHMYTVCETCLRSMVTLRRSSTPNIAGQNLTDATVLHFCTAAFTWSSVSSPCKLCIARLDLRFRVSGFRMWKIVRLPHTLSWLLPGTARYSGLMLAGEGIRGTCSECVVS